jgi:hypothetical protein
MHRLLKFASLLCLFALGACASKTASRMGTAASSPLNDLNIIRTEIPDILLEAQKHPYQLPPKHDCWSLALEVGHLDEVLGPDLDAQAVAANSPSLLDKGSDLAEDQAVGAVQRTAEGLVPFRSWVRKLTGAERHSKDVAAAISAGTARRAFLKGMATSQRCGLSAMPGRRP